MTPSVVIGLDVGSSGTRAVALGEHGDEVATARTPRDPAATTPGGPESAFRGLVPGAIRAEVVATLRAVVERLGGARVRAIALTCFRQTLVLHDAGEPVAAFGNTVAVERQWVRREAPLAASLAEPRLRWLAHAHPSAVAGRPTLATLSGWLVGSLTGVYVEEPTSASTTGLLDPAAGAWAAHADEVCAELGVRLPDVVPWGSVAGELRDDVARSVGLDRPVAVVLAGGDAQAAAHTARMVDPAATVLSCGTHWQQLTARTGDAGAASPAVRVTSGRQPPETYAETLVYYVGATLDEIRRAGTTAADVEIPAEPMSVHVVFRSTLDTTVPIDRGRPVVTWSGPLDVAAAGGWAALRAAAGLGAAFTLDEVVRSVHRPTGTRPFVMVGGAAAAPGWRGVVAAALPGPLVALPHTEAAALGAAHLAWSAVAGPDDPAGAAERVAGLVRSRAVPVPVSADLRDRVDRAREAWRTVREHLRLP